MVGILVGEFEGLTAKDFDVYAEARWSNNVHNLDRMRTRERVLVLARRMRDEAGADAHLALEASREVPGVWNNRQVRDQWAYLLRDAEDRRTVETLVAAGLDLATQVNDAAQHHRHLLLAVRLFHDGLEIGVRANKLARIDVANLIGRAQAEPAALDAILAALPEGFGIDGQPTTGAAELLAAARALQGGLADWLAVSKRLDRGEAMGLGARLGDVAAEAAAALLPLYRFIAWTPQNDFVGAQSRLDELARARAEQAEARVAAEGEAQRQRDARHDEARSRAAALQTERDEWRRMQSQRRRVIEDQRAAQMQAVDRAQPRPGPRVEAPLESSAQAPTEQAGEPGSAAVAERIEPAARPERPARPEQRAERPQRPQGEPRGDRPPRPARGEPRTDKAGQRPERADEAGQRPDRADRGTRPDRADEAGQRPDRAGRGTRPGRADEAGQRPDRADRGTRPERADEAGQRPDRADRGPRPERANKAGPRPERADKGAPRPPRADDADRAPRPERPARPAPEPARAAPEPLEVGAACLLSRGLFAGKEGVVTGRDAKTGEYKVKVGNLEVRVAPGDLRKT